MCDVQWHSTAKFRQFHDSPFTVMCYQELENIGNHNNW